MAITVRGVVSSYAAGLWPSAALLGFFGRFDREPLFHCLALTVVLGLPAVIGASAGQLLLQGGSTARIKHQKSDQRIGSTVLLCRTAVPDPLPPDQTPHLPSSFAIRLASTINMPEPTALGFSPAAI